MQCVFFCHPTFMRSQSMPRFARMIGEAMQAKGHAVQYWAPESWVHGWFERTRLAKWAGYVDQYLLFPLQVMWRMRQQSADTLYVFCDQALGPWVPLVKRRPHIVHAHDLLALRSALGLIPENPTSWSGRLYQRYIRWGFEQARHVICVSRRTAFDLQAYSHIQPDSLHVVYNGINHPYQRQDQASALRTLQSAGMAVTEAGMLLHVGGGQWYKNTAGVIRLYAHYARQTAQPLPLWMISPAPSTPDVQAALLTVPPHAQVYFKQGIDNATLQAAYSVAKAFLFPSLAEGFGWPIIESQVCGCLLLTTDDTPMSEIAGPAATLLPRLHRGDDIDQWAQSAAAQLMAVLNMDEARRLALQHQAMAWASTFTEQRALDAYQAIYQQLMPASVLTVSSVPTP